MAFQSFNNKWLAGFFDGEGSVSLHLGKYKAKTGFRMPYLMVTLTQKNFKLLRAIKTYFGLNAYIGKDKIHLRWEYKNAELVLRRLLPYLVIKKRETLLALAHRDLVGIHRKRGKGAGKGSPYSKKVQNKHMKLRKQLMELNSQ